MTTTPQNKSNGVPTKAVNGSKETKTGDETTTTTLRMDLMDPRITLYAFLTYLDHVRWVCTDDRGGRSGGASGSSSMEMMIPLLLMGLGLAAALPIGPWHHHDHQNKQKMKKQLTNTPADETWKTLVVASSILFGMFRNVAKIPFIWDSEYISSLADIFVGFGLLLSMHPNVLCRTVRDQFAWFYLAAGAWKLNWHFWDDDASCATMFFTQLIARYLTPTDVKMATQLVGMIKPWGPLKTLIVELGMGVLQVAGLLWGWRECERYGAILTVFFHLAVCCVPAPNDISPFAVKCGSRLVMYASVEGAQKSIQWINKWFFTISAIAAVVIAYGIQHEWNIMNWAFAIYIFDLVVVAQALFVKDSSKERTRRNWWCWLGSALTFFYAFGSIMLGLQEQGTPNMFANLKIHGGSNHFFLPTGLLFHWYGNYPDNHPFGGGVLRVENTTSEWMNNMYPCDMTDMLQPAIYPEVLENLGVPRPHYFNPGANRIVHVFNFAPKPMPFYPYTVPALEMKRLFVEAKQKDGDFDLVYSKLPGTKGDEVWRATEVDKRFIVKVRGGNVEQCTVLDVTTMIQTDCGPTDLPMLPDENIPWILRQFSLYHSYPIVTSRREEIPPSIICFGP